MAKYVIREYQRGLYYEKGRFVKLLEPGKYSWWFWESKQIDIVDIRETSQTIEGQEILTSDKIGVRITLITQYKVSNVIAAVHNVENYTSQLYQDLQLTLREAVSSRTLEALMENRESLSENIFEAVSPRVGDYGLTLNRVGVKDIVLPGSVRSIFLQETEADLKGRASLVAARHEIAAARARANVAKMYRENPNLLRLQELEMIASLASKSGNVVVIPGLERLFSNQPDSTTPPENGAEAAS